MRKLRQNIVFTILILLSGMCAVPSAYGSDFSVNVSYENSEPKYYSMPAKNVRELCKEAEYEPLGCTHYNITYHYDYKTYGINERYRVTAVDMKFYYKYGDFYVYIDNRYPQDSCEYNAIKRHEEMHVKVDQTVEIEKVKASLKKCISDVNKQNLEKSALDDAAKSCVQEAFDLDMQIRKQRNIDIDADKNNHPNFGLLCPKH